MKTLIFIILILCNLSANYPTGWMAKGHHTGVSLFATILAHQYITKVYPEVPKRHKAFYSVGFGFTLGLAKEIFDPVFDWEDMSYNALGLGIGYYIIF